MTIRVALHHETIYQYDRQVDLGPQIVRLRPAPHCRTPVFSYSMKVFPESHFCNWQQDPQGNHLARLVFPKPTDRFSVTIDLQVNMVVINPFDFFLESYAEQYPFEYEPWLQKELAPYLQTIPCGPLFEKYLKSVPSNKIHSITLITELNRRLQEDIQYAIRLEPGIQTPEETLTLKKGSCRDSAWLLAMLLRRKGLATRFASGYLIQLAADQKSLDGPSGPETDFCDLHAWTEVYLPGAGWVGLDPTSGLLCGEGHIPLACTPDPTSAAPITGMVGKSECEFSFAMRVDRVHEDPRTTKPYSDDQWESILRLGSAVDTVLATEDVRLTMGGEPTFVSMDDMEGPEWNTLAVGPNKRRLSEDLVRRLRERFAPGSLLHYGQGKWYPGESLPRWALSCVWRTDGVPLWRNPNLIALEGQDHQCTIAKAQEFGKRLATRLGVDTKYLLPAFEDTYYYLWREQRLPIDIKPWDPKLEDAEERARLTRVFTRGLHEPVGLVFPLERQWWQGKPIWRSGPWPVRPEKLFLLPGDSPVGLRLPLDSLPTVTTGQAELFAPYDPTAPRRPLPRAASSVEFQSSEPTARKTAEEGTEYDTSTPAIRTAMCLEPRDGKLCVFMPPTQSLEDYVDLLNAIEATAAELSMPVIVEGYLPPPDWRLQVIKVTPDPGVIEVNIHPAKNWSELVSNTTALYEEARQARLATEKFDLDGKHTGTGGGNHVVLGGPTPLDSPFLRRPDLLKSLLTYWNNHPSLSYMFSSRFIGPTSQAPRVDEGRRDSVYELETALRQIPERGYDCPPWMIDRLLRNLLIDLTGNTHRAEFCIDKLYSPDSSTGRLGLVELRALEMPPHAQMSLMTQLLIRALVATFWQVPYREPLRRWGTDLHDRFMLPQLLWRDMLEVINHLQHHGWEIEDSWFAPHFEFRFPTIGNVEYDRVQIQLRTAVEPWYVLGEEPAGGATVRFVDSSVERLEVLVVGADPERHRVLCNGWQVPLAEFGRPGTQIAGVRYRAWRPASCLHPTIPPHTPLVIDLYDTRAGRALGGCTYHVSHPGGRNYDTFPVNGAEAEARRAARFFAYGHSPGRIVPRLPRSNDEFPTTLDLRNV